jgi:preprotein translocase subunit SecD
MDRSLLPRAILITGIVVFFGFSAYPPKDSINLGLDLLGGMHLVLQVETDDAIRSETDKNIDALQRELGGIGVTGFQVDRTGDAAFDVLGVPADRDGEVRDEVVDRFLPEWSMRRAGDRLQFELSVAEVKKIEQQAVNQARETIRNRIDEFGVAEPVIHEEGLGSNRIVVQLPGVDDPDRVKSLIKSTAFLEFRLAAEGTGGFPSRQAILDHYGGSLPGNLEIMTQDLRDETRQRIVGQQFWALEKQRVVTGRDLKTARSSRGEFGEPTVTFSLTTEGGRQFGEVTGANVGRLLAIVLDKKVVSAPEIQSRISTEGRITGSFTLEEVQDLSMVLRSGALPAGLTYLEERTVGPTLGQDSIDKGIDAGLIGGVIVVLTMLFVYRLVGLNAVFVLGLNIVLVFGALALAGATLTLPGIAGIVLTIGMAVDANVLVFERIREELRSGRTVKSAITAGFGKAFSSIFDANVTTVIAAVFLFMFGTGPIRGFAVTLLVGIAASFFTAIFVSRFLFDVVTSRRRRVDTLPIG